MNGNINGNINDRPERDGKIFPAILKSGSRHLGGSLWDQIPAESLKSLESLENVRIFVIPAESLVTDWNLSRIFRIFRIPSEKKPTESLESH